MFVRSLVAAALLVALLVVHPNPATAQQLGATAPLATVEPYLDTQTIGVVRIDPSRVPLATLHDYVGSLLIRSGALAEDLQGVREQLNSLHAAWTKAGGVELFFVITLADLPQSPGFLVARFRNGGRSPDIEQFMKQANLTSWEMAGPTLLAGTQETLQRLRANQPVEHSGLIEALKLSEGSAVQAALHLSPDVRRVARELAPALPPELGLGKIEELVHAFRWIAIGFDLSPKFSFRATIQAESPAGADRLHGALASVWRAATSDPQFKSSQPQFELLVARAALAVKGNRLSMELVGEESEQAVRDALVGPLAEARRAAAQSMSMNNLKQIALAFHNYHDNYRKFPAAASRNAQGKPLLSWRVQLLPFLDQAALYEKFKLDEPWDSEHNKQLIATMPKTYMAPGQELLAAQGKTCYVVPVGVKSVFAEADGISFQKITDGTSNTVLTLQVPAANAVVWTKPDDWQFDVKKPLDGLLPEGTDGLTIGLCDGSVRFVKKTLNAATWLKLLQINDGQPIEPF